MSREEQLRSAGLTLEERAALKRRLAAIKADLIRHGEEASTFGTFTRHLSQGNDAGWSLKSLAEVPSGAKLVELVTEMRETAAKLASIERLIDDM